MAEDRNGAAEQRILTARVRRRFEAERPGNIVGPLKALPGGHSGLTYTVAVGESSYVIKAVPPGRRPVGRNDVLRQANVLQALEPTGAPIPKVTATDDHEPAWFAMTFEPGEAIEPVLDDDPLESALARTRMLEAARVLRRLHGVDVARLPTDEVLGPGDELDRWTATMRAVPAELRIGSEEVLERLGTVVPEPIDPVLVHGDFRLGNILFVGDRPRAIVDWEIWSVGDPRVDLGWFLVFADDATFPGIGHAVPGLPSRQELLAAYRGEVAVGLPDMSWFLALGMTKMAAIMGHNLRRHREGRHHDPVQEQLPPTIASLIETAIFILSGSGDGLDTTGPGD